MNVQKESLELNNNSIKIQVIIINSFEIMKWDVQKKESCLLC